ncbi:MAG: hypothetical protein IPH20_12010 [Bacteroidales bacterium]|nr:hypothetical protein [Bacteroidales bacterium]
MFKSLKSLFVTTEEEQTAAPAQPSTSSETSAIEANTGNEKVAQKAVDNTILDRLLKAIEDNNQAGFDYLEYRRSLKSLAALPMDEAIKFQSAFATASTMDVTLEKLLASIDFYKKVLLNEDDNFKKASKEQFSVNVEGRLKQKETVNNIIKEKSLSIQKLTEEIRAHQAELGDLNLAIETADAKIKDTTANFNQALEVLISQMDLDAEKLKKYIK